MHLLQWLQNWYAAQCDGDWEHDFGVKIETLDNPGWIVRVDLTGTPLEGETMPSFEKGDVEEGRGDWITCRVNGNRYEGAGDAGKLEEILSRFKRFCDDAPRR
jgi:hypothetical protein